MSHQVATFNDAVAAAPPLPAQPRSTAGAATVTIAYPLLDVSFDPLDPVRLVKRGFVPGPGRIRLEVSAPASKDYAEYALWGPLQGEGGVWRSLPDADPDTGRWVIETTLNRNVQLLGELREPFALTNGSRLVIATSTADANYAEETITFSSGVFVSIGAATAAEVVAVINAQATTVTAEVIEGRVLIRSLKDDSFLQIASADSIEHILGFGYENCTTIYRNCWRGLSSKFTRIYLGLRKQGESWAEEIASDWIVRDEVVPVMPSDIRRMEWFGLPVSTELGRVYSDELIWDDIIAVMADLELETRVRFTPCRVLTEPELRSPVPRLHFDYDLGESAYDYDVRSGRAFWHLQLREYPVLSLEEYEFRDWTNKVVAQFQLDAKLYKESGTIKLVPGVTGTGTWQLFQTQFFLGMMSGLSNWPKWIWIKYTAGPRGGRLEQDAIEAIRKAAWVRGAPVVSDAISRGIVSLSISDGAVSESHSLAASQTTTLFGARMQQYQTWLTDWKSRFADRQKGITAFMI